MSKILSTALITVTLALSSAIASAEEAASMAPQAAPAPAAKTAKPDRLQAMFDKLDANHDGMIDKNEAKANKRLSRSFNKVAKNGKLDKDGFMKWEKKHTRHAKKHKAKPKADKKS